MSPDACNGDDDDDDDDDGSRGPSHGLEQTGSKKKLLLLKTGIPRDVSGGRGQL